MSAVSQVAGLHAAVALRSRSPPPLACLHIHFLQGPLPVTFWSSATRFCSSPHSAPHRGPLQAPPFSSLLPSPPLFPLIPPVLCPPHRLRSTPARVPTSFRPSHLLCHLSSQHISPPSTTAQRLTPHKVIHSIRQQHIELCALDPIQPLPRLIERAREERLECRLERIE